MFHYDLGKSTLEIWEEDEREKRLDEYRRKKQLENVVNGLANLIRKHQNDEELQTASNDMIEEGGPVYAKQGENDE